MTDTRRKNSPTKPDEAMAEHAADAARLLKSLSHEKRLLILCMLVEGEMTVGEINARVPGSQSVISQHLAVLRRDDLVQTRRDAQTIYYSLRGVRAARIIEVLHDLFCGQAANAAAGPKNS
jgi:DNA-binding transcriptional ArsR family regulator